jgi:hypothetical protein
MSFITEAQLKGYRNTTRYYAKSLNESLREFKGESKYSKTTIFLSHKHDELEALDGAISFLKKEGIDVYVDWLDEGMPKTTSGETARRIKQKIKENDKFILLASEGAINSKWCNWELGLGDSAKYIDNIALLPVRKDNTSFSGAEYLQIYPYIKYEDGYGKYTNGNYIPAGYYVLFPEVNGNHKIISLKTWLKK